MTKEPDTLKLKEVLDSTVKFRSTVREFARNPPLILPGIQLLHTLICLRSGGGVVDNRLDYQSSCLKIDPPLLRSFG